MTRNPQARDTRGSGTTEAGRRRNSLGGQTDRDVDSKTLGVRNGSLRVMALDTMNRPLTGATLEDLVAAVQDIVDRLKGSG